MRSMISGINSSDDRFPPVSVRSLSSTAHVMVGSSFASTFAAAHQDAASHTCSRAHAVAPPKARPSLAIAFDRAGTLFQADHLGSLSSPLCLDMGGSAMPSNSDGAELSSTCRDVSVGAVTPSLTSGFAIASLLG